MTTVIGVRFKKAGKVYVTGAATMKAAALLLP